MSGIPCRLRLEKMFGLVHSPRERGTTSHHGSQVSLFFLLTKTVFFLVSLLSPTMLFANGKFKNSNLPLGEGNESSNLYLNYLLDMFLPYLERKLCYNYFVFHGEPLTCRCLQTSSKIQTPLWCALLQHQKCTGHPTASASYSGAFRRRRGAAEDCGKDELGKGSFFLSVLPTILCVLPKATGYESATACSQDRLV